MVQTDSERREVLLAKLERWTDWPLTILAMALLGILLAPHVVSLSPQSVEALDDLDYLIWGLFAADLATKLMVAPRRFAYLRRHWFDVVLVIVPMLRPVRVLRSARVVRVARSARVVAAASKITVDLRQFTRHRGIQYVVSTALIVVVLGGALVVAFERNAPDSNINSLSDGLWWAMTTITTVGYGDTYPTTAAGRGVGVALMIVGVALFGALAANLATVLITKTEDDAAIHLRTLSERVGALERTLREISQRDLPVSRSDVGQEFEHVDDKPETPRSIRLWGGVGDRGWLGDRSGERRSRISRVCSSGSRHRSVDRLRRALRDV